MATVTGGDAAVRYLKRIGDHVRNLTEVRVGFLADKTYPDGKSVAMIAAIQEFGARIEVEPHETTIYRSINLKTGEFKKEGKFVKKSKSNFASDHYVGAHVITIPSRPFFRNAIAQYGDAWGGQIAKLLPQQNYNAHVTLALMGELIVGQIRQSITDLVDPPLAPSTIKKKGFDKPLIDTGTMRNSVDYEVVG